MREDSYNMGRSSMQNEDHSIYNPKELSAWGQIELPEPPAAKTASWSTGSRYDAYPGASRTVDNSYHDPFYLPEAAKLENLDIGDRKKKKKKLREVIEDDEWSKKKSGKERDRIRHGREFVIGDFEAREIDDEVRETKQQRKARKEKEKEALFDVPEIIPVYLPEFISVSHLAQMLKVSLDSFVRKLAEMGYTELSSDLGMYDITKYSNGANYA